MKGKTQHVARGVVGASGHWASVVAVCGFLMMIPMAHADDTDNAALKAEVEVLKSRLAALESKLAGSQTFSTTAPSLGQKAGLPTLELPSGLQGLQMSGYVDTSYVYNFNGPDAGASRTNRGRVFDVNSNSFTPQAAELVLEKPETDSMPIGFRTDLFFGDDAEVIHATGLGNATQPFDLQQAYITLKAPMGSGLDFKVGKFVTLLGAEVIESPANWNFSRSFLFGYAIPFTHTGALASYSFGDLGSATFGVVNGWDLADENNSFKTMLGQLTLTPIKSVTLSTNLITGAERPSDNRNDRTVLDLVATWQPLEKLTLMANYDYGHESSVTHGVAGTAGPDSANWQGLALYAKYDLTDKWALAGRWEFFNDMDNVRTAFTGPGGTTLDNLHFTEFTLTSQWKLYEHLLARLEFRQDNSNERVFFRAGSAFRDYQDTISGELIYHF